MRKFVGSWRKFWNHKRTMPNPVIAGCKDCDEYRVVIGEDELPLDMELFSQRLLEQVNCPSCGSQNTVLDQSPAALEWYNKEKK